MERSVFMKDGGNWVCTSGPDEMFVSSAVRSVLTAFSTSAINLVRTSDGDLVIETEGWDVVRRNKVIYRGAYHGFFDLQNVGEVVAELKEALFSRSVQIGVLESSEINDLVFDFISRFLDSPENDIEKKFKAVLVVIHGGARTREEVERLVELEWWKLLAAVQLARSEQMSAVEVLDLLEPVAA
ncbi:MAG: hypothetical protein WC242_00230 [Candidatus Paceibacterota bacterium]|jgi:hypothetical protein